MLWLNISEFLFFILMLYYKSHLFNLATKDESKEDRTQKRGKKGKMKKVKAKYKDQVVLMLFFSSGLQFINNINFFKHIEANYNSSIID